MASKNETHNPEEEWKEAHKDPPNYVEFVKKFEDEENPIKSAYIESRNIQKRLVFRFNEFHKTMNASQERIRALYTENSKLKENIEKEKQGKEALLFSHQEEIDNMRSLMGVKDASIQSLREKIKETIQKLDYNNSLIVAKDASIQSLNRKIKQLSEEIKNYKAQEEDWKRKLIEQQEILDEQEKTIDQLLREQEALHSVAASRFAPAEAAGYDSRADDDSVVLFGSVKSDSDHSGVASNRGGRKKTKRRGNRGKSTKKKRTKRRTKKKK